MLDTVLNVGLNDRSVHGLPASPTTNGSPGTPTAGSCRCSATSSTGCPASSSRTRSPRPSGPRASRTTRSSRSTALKQLVEQFKGFYDFPADPQEQLRQAIRAVFDSWTGERAVSLPPHQPHPRRVGNRGQRPADGVRQQGRGLGDRGRVQPGRGDRRAGAVRRLPRQRPGRGRRRPASAPRATSPSCAEVMPETHAQLMEILRTLEAHYKDMQDTEFTVEEGRLYMLQTRSAKRPAQAAVRFAVDAVAEGLLTREEALATIDAYTLDALLASDLRPRRRLQRARPRGRRLAGRGAGEIVFNAPDAVSAAAGGQGCDPGAAVHRGRRRGRLPRREGDPHLRGRQGFARRARGPRHGRARGDRRGGRDRPRAGRAQDRRTGVPGRRPDRDRWQEGAVVEARTQS